MWIRISFPNFSFHFPFKFLVKNSKLQKVKAFVNFVCVCVASLLSSFLDNSPFSCLYNNVSWRSIAQKSKSDFFNKIQMRFLLTPQSIMGHA